MNRHNIQEHRGELPLGNLQPTVLEARCPTSNGFVFTAVRIFINIAVWRVRILVEESGTYEIILKATGFLIIPSKNHDRVIYTTPKAIVNMKSLRVRDDLSCTFSMSFMLFSRGRRGMFVAYADL